MYDIQQLNETYYIKVTIKFLNGEFTSFYADSIYSSLQGKLISWDTEDGRISYPLSVIFSIQEEGI